MNGFARRNASASSGTWGPPKTISVSGRVAFSPRATARLRLPFQTYVLKPAMSAFAIASTA
jgi:hypothetical protein